MDLSVTFSPEAYLDDLRALLDSYAVKLSKNGLDYLCCPISFIRNTDGIGFSSPVPESKRSYFVTNFQIDKTFSLSLVQYEPYTEDRDLNTRWPFFVNHPLSIKFTLNDQWWQFKFSPSKTYTERGVEEK